MVLYHNSDHTSCYIISILYILQNIPYLSDYIKKYKSDDNLLIIELQKLFLNNEEKTFISDFKKLAGTKNEMWNEIIHHDSHEFYEFLINQIIDDSKLEYKPDENHDLVENNFLHIIAMKQIHQDNKIEFSLIKNFNIGYFCSEIICDYCSSTSPKFESFITIQLSIIDKKNIDLYDCLFEYTKMEFYNNIKKCSFCNINENHPKKLSFWKLPKILVIQLRKYDSNGNKLNNHIYYPCTLDMTTFMHTKSPYKKCHYSLCGINIHSGTMNYGHYISYIKENNKWFAYNDSNEPEEIKDIQNNNAYILFYQSL